jgi:hypothetical protein
VKRTRKILLTVLQELSPVSKLLAASLDNALSLHTLQMMKHTLLLMVLLWELLGYFPSAFDGPPRDRVEDRIESRRVAEQPEDAGEMDLGELSTTGVRLPPEARVECDVPYGNDPQQRLDVYIPGQAKGGRSS